LSRRGQGQPTNEEIDAVIFRMAVRSTSKMRLLGSKRYPLLSLAPVLI
jgi:hypothetical protein